MLEPRIAQELQKLHQKQESEGKLLSQAQLKKCWDTFRQRFGPERLQSLDGEALLTTMHDHSNRDSLVYWLEFKDDNDLPACFGSIAGGSALKFGIYRRKETGAWITGTPQAQRELPLEEAIGYARKHRDQLVQGASLLEKLPQNASDQEYQKLQEEMNRVAPEVSNLAWGHKYFSLLYPEKLDDYHAPAYQRFHLVKLLQIPPPGDGRYLAAGRYVAIARELGMSLNHLTTLLNLRDGNPYRYWRIGTSDGTAPRNRWELMRTGNLVAIGWPALGELSGITGDKDSKESLRTQLKAHYPKDPRAIGRNTQQIFHFLVNVQPGDLVLASDGGKVLGIGKVKGDYFFEPSSDFPHCRPVEWLSFEEWPMPTREGLLTTVYEIKQAENQVAVERRVLAAPVIGITSPGATPRLEGIPGRIQAVLARKGQVILYGPPGTGKTHWAERTARDLAAYTGFGAPFAALKKDQRKIVLGKDSGLGGTVRMCSFHPAYGYEDFLEGYRPEAQGKEMVFSLRDGIFKTLCCDARQNPRQSFYLIIDEINRGDIPRIFGELLTILEKSRRGKPILLPLSREEFFVPSNVYLIGTMNTADRSIALLDTALRRRFGFLELMPDSAVLGDASAGGIPLGPWLDALNQRVCLHVGRDARNLQIGHSYLLNSEKPITDLARFAQVLQEDIVPLLEEYCYEDYAALEKVLGSGLVDARAQRVRHELFTTAKHPELVQALLAPCPEIVTSRQAIASEAASNPEEEPESEGDDNGDQ